MPSIRNKYVLMDRIGVYFVYSHALGCSDVSNPGK